MSDTPPAAPIDLGQLATEPPEESARAGLDSVAEVPDTGELTPSEDAQRASDGDDSDGPSAGLLSARLPFGSDPA